MLQSCLRAGLVMAALSFTSACRADVFLFTAQLTGAAESPPNASPGTGSALITFDTVANTLRVQVIFSGLLGTTTAAHIHAATATAGVGTAGVATQVPTFTNFPLGVTSGSMDQTLDLTNLGSFNPAYVTANGNTAASAAEALLTASQAGKAYLNLHTTTFGGGEIRGFLQAVPEPSCLVLAGVGGLVVLGLKGRTVLAQRLGR